MMNKKNILKYTAALLMLIALLVPRLASAASASEVQDIAQKAFRLCALDSKKYSNSCKVADELNKIAQAAAKLPADKQAAYIKKEAPKFASTQAAVNKNYLSAVSNGDITSNGGVSGGSNKSFEGDCNNGGVKISVGVNGTNECVGGNGVNPIYAYLRGIIILLGGAIGLAVVITIIVAGIQYSSSAGNPANITKAKERLMNAVIGLVLYLFLAAILRYLVPQIFTS